MPFNTLFTPSFVEFCNLLLYNQPNLKESEVIIMTDKELTVEVVKSIIQSVPSYRNQSGSMINPLSMTDIKNFIENVYTTIHNLPE